MKEKQKQEGKKKKIKKDGPARRVKFVSSFLLYRRIVYMHDNSFPGAASLSRVSSRRR